MFESARCVCTRKVSKVRSRQTLSKKSLEAFPISNGVNSNATYEYYTFLGYSVASNAELLEDYLDICLGRYEERGVKGEMGEKGREEIEKLRFYPLDTRLPRSVQLYLRVKELNMLLDKLQASLLLRMQEKKTLGTNDRSRLAEETRAKKSDEQDREFEKWLEREEKVWTTSGIVSKEEARTRNLPLIKGKL